jgi:hypothetical protein
MGRGRYDFYGGMKEICDELDTAIKLAYKYAMDENEGTYNAKSDHAKVEECEINSDKHKQVFLINYPTAHKRFKKAIEEARSAREKELEDRLVEETDEDTKRNLLAEIKNIDKYEIDIDYAIERYSDILFKNEDADQENLIDRRYVGSAYIDRSS